MTIQQFLEEKITEALNLALREELDRRARQELIEKLKEVTIVVESFDKSLTKRETEIADDVKQLEEAITHAMDLTIRAKTDPEAKRTMIKILKENRTIWQEKGYPAMVKAIDDRIAELEAELQ